MATSASTHRVIAIVAVLAATRATHAQVAGAAGIGASVPAQIGPIEIRGGAVADRMSSSVGPRTTLDVRSTVALTLGDGGVWTGVSALRAREIDTLPMRPLFEAGLWRSFRNLTLRVGGASHIARLGGRPMPHGQGIQIHTDSGATSPAHLYIPPGDSGIPSHTTRWSDAEAALSWTSGRFAADLVLGSRPAIDVFPRARWARFATTIQLASQFAFVAAVGAQPAQIALGIPPTHFATIALNVAPPRRRPTSDVLHPTATAAAPFSVRRDDAGRYVLTLRMPAAHRVEVSGDFDGWEPIDLRETQPGMWSGTLAIAPGTYHMNVRVDGGRWSAPPGTTTVDDDFNGTVGIVVVR